MSLDTKFPPCTLRTVEEKPGPVFLPCPGGFYLKAGEMETVLAESQVSEEVIHFPGGIHHLKHHASPLCNGHCAMGHIFFYLGNDSLG